ncbi:ATPase, T2SS/T4P/T4SS family [Paenibacillus sp. WLX2291]|uniref:ATPase, T2SS/T4P/T4SS family n=1 Tax=Paenibacillus sp. WLX2291 TaxID=3296934 RepID=UPI003983ED21
MAFVQSLPTTMKTLVVEMPCLSLPRLAIPIWNDKQLRQLSSSQSMDQLVLDMDRKQLKPLSDYLSRQGQTDYVLLNPHVLLDQSLMKQVQHAKTLMDLPSWVVNEARDDYDVILLVTQGKLDMATTFFSLQQADACVFMIGDIGDWTYNRLTMERLIEEYQFPAQQFFFYTTNRSIAHTLKEPLIVSPKVLWNKIKDIPLSRHLSSSLQAAVSDQYPIGYIHPIDFLTAPDGRQVVMQPVRSTVRQTKDWVAVAERIRQQLQEQHLDDFVASLMDAEARQRVRFYISDLLRMSPAGSLPGALEDVTQFVQKEITELGILQPLLDDPSVVNIEINGPKQIVIEKSGQVMQVTDVAFEDIDHLYRIINRMLNVMGKQLTSNEPVIDTVYHGTRVCAVADRERRSGLSMGSPIVSIRKFPPRVLSDEEYIASGTASPDMLAFLSFAVRAGSSIVSVGGTNAGKTTAIIRFLLYLDRLTRVISIEDSPEAMLSSKEQYLDYPNLISLLTKIVEDPAKSYPPSRLIRTSLRLNPWGFLIGESRDEDGASEMLKAANTGHVVWTTTHGNGMEEGATRILQLCGNTQAAAAQISQSLDLFLFLQRQRDGRRPIMGIGELVRYEGVEKPVMNVIFRFDRNSKRHIQVGHLKTNRMRDKIYNQDQFSEDEIQRWCRFETEDISYQEVER